MFADRNSSWNYERARYFSDFASIGAKIGAVEAAPCFGCVAARLVPHLMQKAASSGSWVPHLGQNKLAVPHFSNSPIIS
jgi:hypothetical protein